jgi:hypothetical protein
MPIKTKLCSKCHRNLPITEFYPSKKGLNGLTAQCKDCYSREAKIRKLDPLVKKKDTSVKHIWEETNKLKMQKVRKDYRQEVLNGSESSKRASFKSKLKHKYNITVDQYETLKQKQDNRCAICGIELTGLSHIDHCHKTGKVRGILCFGCNIGIGHLKDDIKLLKSAIKYLETAENEEGQQQS